MKSIKDLQAIRERALDSVNMRKDQDGIRIVVGMATCGIAAGARPVMLKFVERLTAATCRTCRSARPDASACAALSPWWRCCSPARRR